MSPWRDHDGGACPVHPDTMCRFRFRNDHESKVDQFAKGFVWHHRGEPFDIIAYQVVSVPQEIRE